MFNLIFFLYLQVADKFYELTNIRHNIISAYHPQANGEDKRLQNNTGGLPEMPRIP